MFQIISYFYFSKDIKILTFTNNKPKYYLISKFFCHLFMELIIALFVVAPFLSFMLSMKIFTFING